MFKERLVSAKKRYEEINELMIRQDVVSDNERYTNLAREHSALQPLIEAFENQQKLEQTIDEAREIIKNERDLELIELAREELEQSRLALEQLERDLKIMLLPPDPNDEKNVIIEIRAGAGGDEAGLFGAALMRMYKMFAEANRFKVEDIDINDTEIGGIKEATFMISGNGAYSKMKFESGVHRVQRVPATESQGRIHTSTVTVAVLPEAGDVVVDINEKDLKIDTYRASGAGGQHVNKTESAIRITHLPTGMVVACQDEKSQIKNREKAMRVLKSRLYDFYQSQADKEYAESRRAQVGTGDRSERIRTYNYPQGRVTDHRIGFTIYSLTEFLNGDISEMVNALRSREQEEKLQRLSEQG